MNKVINGIQILLLIVLPIVYFECYRAAEIYTQNKLSNFAYSNNLIPILLCALIVCLFTGTILEVGKCFCKDSYLKTTIVIVIMLAHLIFSYLAPTIIVYYMYIEVVSSFLVVIFILIVESLMGIYRSKKSEDGKEEKA